jgi:hypothetical protein
MTTRQSKLARKYAQRISNALSSKPFTKLLRDAAPGYEHKAVARDIESDLESFLQGETEHKVTQQQLFDWEGKNRRGQEGERYYPVLGITSFPDAAVLAPFKCAFEFDREPSKKGSHFKTALMKASVHVLSGAYDSCVFVYILRPGSSRRAYLPDKCKHTQRLIETLQAVGLYVTFIRNRPS